jgi:peptide/nickel transport system ATP-binding protein
MSVPIPRPARPAQPSPEPAPLLDVRALRVRFPTEDGAVDAVRDMSFTLGRGEVLAIVGESGSGKSTSGLALAGLLPRSAQVGGEILFEGQDLLTMPEKHRRALRGRRIAMIFQNSATALNPVLTVGDQLAECLRADQALPRRVALARAAEALELVGIPRPAERLRSYPHEFSGGMRQRVLIAMAMLNRPDVLVADEPTSALDVTVQAQVLRVLLAVRDAVGAAIMLITHDLGVVAATADRVLVMYAGRPVEVGTTPEVLRSPRMPYTAGLLGAVPGRGHHRLRSIPGAPPSMLHLPAGCPFRARCPVAHDPCHSAEPALERTDHPGHLSACHSWPSLAELADPRSLFATHGAVTQ